MAVWKKLVYLGVKKGEHCVPVSDLLEWSANYSGSALVPVTPFEEVADTQ